MVAHTDTFLAGGNGVVVAVLLWHVLLKLANGLASPGLDHDKEEQDQHRDRD